MRLLMCLAGLVAAVAVGQAAGARPLGEAQDRCLTYGFKSHDMLARCTDYEMQFPEPKHWGFSAISQSQNRCLRLGYRGDPLALCTQRGLRESPTE